MAGVIKKFAVKYKYNIGCKILNTLSLYKNVYKKLQRLHLDVLTEDQWTHTELHFQACMFAEDLAPDRHNIVALSRPSSSGNISTPSFPCIYGCLSSHSTLQPVSYRRCRSSSHTPVDRAGGVKGECLTSLILWSYGNIFFCSCKI